MEGRWEGEKVGWRGEVGGGCEGEEEGGREWGRRGCGLKVEGGWEIAVDYPVKFWLCMFGRWPNSRRSCTSCSRRLTPPPLSCECAGCQNRLFQSSLYAHMARQKDRRTAITSLPLHPFHPPSLLHSPPSPSLLPPSLPPSLPLTCSPSFSLPLQLCSLTLTSPPHPHPTPPPPSLKL